METHTPTINRSATTPTAGGPVKLVKNASGFDDWAGLLHLLRSAFSYTQGVVFPPSTVFEMSEADLQLRAKNENLVLGLVDDRPVACLFIKDLPDKLFLGRFAIASPYRGRGLARKMIEVAEAHAKASGLSVLELETRVELTANQAKFRALGFETCGGRAHEGCDYQTTLTFRKRMF